MIENTNEFVNMWKKIHLYLGVFSSQVGSEVHFLSSVQQLQLIR